MRNKRPHANALTPCMLVSAATSLVGMVDDRNGTGLLVRSMLRRVGLKPGDPWGAAFVSYVGFQSHQIPGMRTSTWPLPRTGRVEELVDFGQDKGIVDREGDAGDLALIWTPDSRTPRVGIVQSISVVGSSITDPDWAIALTTVEGNTTAAGTPGGPGVHAVYRFIRRGAGVQFLRWSLLDGRGITRPRPTKAQANTDPISPNTEEHYATR